MALTKIPSELSSTTGIVDNSNATAITIDSSENVGIGTSSPITALHIADTHPTVYLETSGGGSTDAGFLQKYDNQVYLYNKESAGSLILGTNNTERLRIDSSGNLLVGKTSAAGRSTAGIEARGDGVLIATKAGTVQYLNRTGSNGTILDLSKSGTTVGSISVTTTSTSYNTSSDYRLKENVVELTGATERLKQLNPSRFNFIADADTTVDGFLAHEVADVVPEAISGEKDAVDADGNPEYQGIDQSKLVPLLVATIQELEARITELENN